MNDGEAVGRLDSGGDANYGKGGIADTVNKLRDMIVDPNTEYYRLESKEYEATMGRDYFHLKERMSNWSYSLHVNGLNLPPSDLEIIFKYGLMTWYIQHMTEHTRIGLELRGMADEIEQNKRRIRFYDFKKLMIVYRDLEVRPEIPQNLTHLQKYQNYQLLMKDSGWKYVSFHRYLVMNRLYESYGRFVRDLNTYVEESHRLDMVRYIESNGQKIMNTEMIREMVWSEDLRRLGIFFQRWKVAIEKLGRTCQNFNSDDTLDTEQKKKTYDRLLFYDRLVTRVQELVFLLLRQGISTVHEIEDPVTRNLELPVYQEILKWIRESNRALLPYNDVDLILKEIEHFLL